MLSDDQLKFLQDLLDTPSPSGFERDVQRVFYKRVQEVAPNLTIDAYGNVIGRVDGASQTRVLLAGHADEIGLIVKYIDDRGFLYVGEIGGVDPLVLLGHRVRLLGPRGVVHGVIGRIPIHVQDSEERGKSKVKLHELWVDIGAKSAEEAGNLVPVGTPAIWGDDFRRLHGQLATARDFDNKVGVFIVAETLRALALSTSKPGVTVLGASTIQEECGVWGAGPVAFALDPAAAIAIDVTHATDYPGIEKKRFGDIALGKGPVIYSGVKSSKVLTRSVIETAARHNIAIQRKAEGGRFGTDADPISQTRGGIPVTMLSIPLRYMHTSSEVISLDDLEAAILLLTESLQSLPPNTDWRPFHFD